MQQWNQVMQAMIPLAAAVDALPTAALRQYLGTVITAAPYLPKFTPLNPLENLKLSKTFQNILNQAMCVYVILCLFLHK